MARLLGYQRPPQGGWGECRRACERTPSRAAATAPPASADIIQIIMGHAPSIATTKYGNPMSLSPRCAARSRRSRAVIILVGQHVLAESGLPDLGSCATLVVPEMGGEGKRKKPSLTLSKAPTRSTHTLVGDYSRSSRRSSPPSIGFPRPSGYGGEI
jgi:hypothetical protein